MVLGYAESGSVNKVSRALFGGASSNAWMKREALPPQPSFS